MGAHTTYACVRPSIRHGKRPRRWEMAGAFVCKTSVDHFSGR
jgi:hypothetical protein